MTTTTSAADETLAEHQHIVLDDVSWDLYEHLLAEVGDRPIRVTFDDGSLEIMSPLPQHEKWKKRITRLVEILSLELDIAIETLGSTTFRRKDRKKGLEPDECYYIQNASAVEGKDDLDLTSDPPPDLAIEIEITRRVIPRQPIYAALGVPEVWRFDSRHPNVLLLGSDGKYGPAKSSRAFPFLPMATFESFLLRLGSEPQNAVLREFRDWVRTLANSAR